MSKKKKAVALSLGVLSLVTVGLLGFTGNETLAGWEAASPIHSERPVEQLGIAASPIYNGLYSVKEMQQDIKDARARGLSEEEVFQEIWNKEFTVEVEGDYDYETGVSSFEIRHAMGQYALPIDHLSYHELDRLIEAKSIFESFPFSIKGYENFLDVSGFTEEEIALVNDYIILDEEEQLDKIIVELESWDFSKEDALIEMRRAGHIETEEDIVRVMARGFKRDQIEEAMENMEYEKLSK